MMAYTETKTTGFFQRIGSSFAGIGAGILLFLGASWWLYHNEGDYVYTGDAITEAQRAFVELPEITKLDSSFEGKLVHATGMTATKDTLTDNIFGLQTVAVKLQRKAEYYQWTESSRTETRKKLGGGEEQVTTYTYSQAWVNSPVDSGAFKDQQYIGRNSVLANIPEETIVAPNVTFGAYTLPQFLKNSISGDIPLNVQLTDQKLAELTKYINPTAAKSGTSQPNSSPWDQMPGYGRTDDAVASQAGVHVLGNSVYLGITPASPRIGDVRVTFTEVKPAQISIVAKVIGNTFEQYRSSNGKTFSAFSMGSIGAEKIFADAHAGNSMMTWIVRIVGILLVITGLKMVMAPLSVLASVIPLLGSIVGAGTGIVAFLLGLAWSLIVIAISWLIFRPLIGGALVLVAMALVALLYKKGRNRKAAEAALQ
ncbi:MAG: TMEM43 family protein [Deltaproteobacteria bacterium]|nr:TMEM43 family protein [Deltaproteobacteria bacterium]